MQTFRQIFIVALAASAGILLAACASTGSFSAGKGGKYGYTYRLVRPAENADLLFRDDSLIVQFRFDEAAVRFQLQNLGRSPAHIDWEQASLGLNGRYYSVRHSTNLYGDSLASSRAQRVPPYGYIRDLLIPADHVYFDGRRWVELELFPTTDNDSETLRESILRAPGQSLSVVLPLIFGREEKFYRFDFVVDSVKRIAWHDYRPFRRNPPPPKVETSSGGIDQITAAVLTVGVLGFTAYMISIKKNPPVE